MPESLLPSYQVLNLLLDQPEPKESKKQKKRNKRETPRPTSPRKRQAAKALDPKALSKTK